MLLGGETQTHTLTVKIQTEANLRIRCYIWVMLYDNLYAKCNVVHFSMITTYQNCHSNLLLINCDESFKQALVVNFIKEDSKKENKMAFWFENFFEWFIKTTGINAFIFGKGQFSYLLIVVSGLGHAISRAPIVRGILKTFPKYSPLLWSIFTLESLLKFFCNIFSILFKALKELGHLWTIEDWLICEKIDCQYMDN